jgi:hypothetical protein
MYPIEKYQFKVYEHKNEDGTKSSVVMALSTHAGKVVKGVAKCAQDDPFDLEKGKELAAARCDYKVCSKRLKSAEKKNEMSRKLVDEALEYCKRMSSYYLDAYDEYMNSKSKLQEIENELN